MKQISTAFSSSDLGAGSIAGETCRYFFGCPRRRLESEFDPIAVGIRAAPVESVAQLSRWSAVLAACATLVVVRGSLPRLEVSNLRRIPRSRNPRAAVRTAARTEWLR